MARLYRGGGDAGPGREAVASVPGRAGPPAVGSRARGRAPDTKKPWAHACPRLRGSFGRSVARPGTQVGTVLPSPPVRAGVERRLSTIPATEHLLVCRVGAGRWVRRNGRPVYGPGRGAVNGFPQSNRVSLRGRPAGSCPPTAPPPAPNPTACPCEAVPCWRWPRGRKPTVGPAIGRVAG